LSEIRAQYHFRPSKDGLLAWDVRRLIKLSKNFSPTDIPINKIAELQEAYWFDQTDSVTTEQIIDHMKLTHAADLSYPIILCHEGRLMDGMHRVCKAVLEGRKTILAVKFPNAINPDYTGVEPDKLPYV